MTHPTRTRTRKTTRTASRTKTDTLEARAARLDTRLTELGTLIVAFSGGIDSAFLAVTAARVLGPNALAVTAVSASYPETHRQLALRVAAEFQLRHEFIETSELARPEYRANPANRCYFCKDELFVHLAAMARARGVAFVADGNNADDRGDYRPGRQAAREHGVVSPLDEADLGKDDVRELARRAGMSTWDEPASACLSSRIPYGTEVTDDKLRQIERAEAAVRALGFRVFRVRHHEATARLEIARDEMARALEPAVNERLLRELKGLGYQYVSLDLQGYRVGSLNEALPLRPVP
ncbi:MAG TPA: ATP-dependent sacrificial sulfur transferase LarE [Vicinamibacterales bacterium]|nr:ATP-dependent sacrificial sulfur transferase LarE [Vicinamibacterales bacterium]